MQYKGHENESTFYGGTVQRNSNVWYAYKKYTFSLSIVEFILITLKLNLKVQYVRLIPLLNSKHTGASE